MWARWRWAERRPSQTPPSWPPWLTPSSTFRSWTSTTLRCLDPGRSPRPPSVPYLPYLSIRPVGCSGGTPHVPASASPCTHLSLPPPLPTAYAFPFSSSASLQDITKAPLTASPLPPPPAHTPSLASSSPSPHHLTPSLTLPVPVSP